MSVIRSTGWMVSAIAAFATAGCVMTGSNLTNSAQRLERNAYELHRDTRHDATSSSYSRDAQAFAEETGDFRDVIEDRTASDDDVQDAFRDLSRHYHSLRDEVERSDSRDVAREFKPVTEAYLDVEREIRRDGHLSDDRYVHDDDHHHDDDNDY